MIEMATLYQMWPLVLSMPTPAPPPFIIQTSEPAPWWSYFVPFATALTAVIAAVIAYFAAKQQARGTITAMQMQLDAAKEAREHSEAAKTLRRKSEAERRSRAVRAQILLYTRLAAESVVTEGTRPGQDDFSNAELVETFARVSNRAHDLDVIEALKPKEMKALLHVVGVNEALLTHLRPFWKEVKPSAETIKQIRLVCVIALRSMHVAITKLGFGDDFYSKHADNIEGLANDASK